MNTKQKYEVSDSNAPLFEEPSIIEANSPKQAAEKVFGRVKVSKYGYIVVLRMQYPFRSYVYERVN